MAVISALQVSQADQRRLGWLLRTSPLPQKPSLAPPGIPAIEPATDLVSSLAAANKL